MKSELNLDLTRIQIYPTNQYTPAVQRLLQVTANLYEATTNNPFPTIFRPYFTSDGTNIFISGYELVNGPDTLPTSPTFLTIPIDLTDPAARAAIGETPTHLNVYSVPWIIGARKGLPNLNEVAMQSVAQITRKLLIRRPDTTTIDFSQYQTSQLLIIGVSNSVGVEVWNSYSNNYPRPVYVQVDGELSMTLTNDAGMALSSNYALGGANLAPSLGAINLASNQWQGTGWVPGYSTPTSTLSFQVPLLTNVIFLPDSAYRQNPPGFIPVPPDAVQSWSINPPGSFPQPHWRLNVTDRIRCMIIDGGPGERVVDYVQLNGLNSFRDFGGEINTADRSVSITNMWSTNFINGILGNMPLGLANQIYVALGDLPASDADWANTMIAPPTGQARLLAIDSFRVFFHLMPLTYPNTVNTQLVMQVPFTPTSKRFQPLIWQANDPLVHYTVTDLSYPGASNKIYKVIPPGSSFPQLSSNFWRYADRYDPWGGNPSEGPFRDVYAFNVALKDPLVRASDDWDFPSGEPLSFATLGRIHRGTPWQTIYLKSAAVDPNLWTQWTGITDNSAALATMPTNDWRQVTLLGLILNTNNPRHLLPINDADTNAWLEVLEGLTVITNSSPPLALVMSSNSPQAVLIANAVQQARTARPNQQFSHLGDILATPQLSLASPWLNMNNVNALNSATDEACEMIPSQLLSRLREDSIGSVISTDNQIIVQFSGYDHYAYAIEASSDLVHWITISTKHPSYGVFGSPLSAAPKARHRFYRSVLLPRVRAYRDEKFLFYTPNSVFIGGDESRDSGCRQRHADAGAHQ